jgi:hypothetical protein
MSKPLTLLFTRLNNYLLGQRAAERYVSGEEDETGGAGKAQDDEKGEADARAR